MLGGLQVGGGINDKNAPEWLAHGASKVRFFYDSRRPKLIRLKVIVTSYLFPSAKFSIDRLKALSEAIGKDRLVVDIRSYPANYCILH